MKRIVAAVAASALALVTTGCGIEGGNMFGDEPNTPVAVSGLPSDPKDASRELRRRLVGEGVAIARGLAFPVQRAVFAFEAGRNRKLRKA
ncbi:hypothetical protein, partial [Austwickia sp. TVS 96-490-7B]|uniref:hypothetical protein n=1 Tax=Austwickia sp. TVS 96-490-7B TaxID=2830843 RepID=UPI001C565776